MHTIVKTPVISNRVFTMEMAASDLWRVLGKLSVADLKALRPTGLYVPLIDALIDVRSLMDNP